MVIFSPAAAAAAAAADAAAAAAAVRIVAVGYGCVENVPEPVISVVSSMSLHLETGRSFLRPIR